MGHAYRAANRRCGLQGCTMVEGKCALYLRPLATRQALVCSKVTLPASINVSTLGIVVLHVAVACAVPFQRAQWHATLRATRARNAPANVTIGFRFVGLCGTMFTPVLEYVIATPCLQIPSRWGAFWWRMGWSNLMMISYIAQRLIPASIC